MDDRPAITAQKRFLEHRDALRDLSLNDRFEFIFRSNLWGAEESRSGLGATLPETETLRIAIPALLDEIGAKSLLDIPCGDFSWLSQAALDVDYIGADIVWSLVKSNQGKHGSERRRFVRLDLTAHPLPRADVVLCRDCLVHLSYANIRRALENLKRSGSTYLLTTSFLEIQENRNIEDGDWRPLNLTKEPFSFPPPLKVIVENCAEAGGAYRDKALCLWRLADLA